MLFVWDVPGGFHDAARSSAIFSRVRGFDHLAGDDGRDVAEPVLVTLLKRTGGISELADNKLRKLEALQLGHAPTTVSRGIG
jgi:hypothetical protein